MARGFCPTISISSICFPQPQRVAPPGAPGLLRLRCGRLPGSVGHHAGYRKDELRGRPGYHPALLTKLLIYGYAQGKVSSRKLERATYEEVPYRVLAGNSHPDHDSIASFRKRHLSALAGLFTQVLRLCQQAGLVKLGHVALDGSKLKASASKHKAMSYARLCRSEEELRKEVERLLAEAERKDQEEDRLYGKDKRGDELPRNLPSARAA